MSVTLFPLLNLFSKSSSNFLALVFFSSASRRLYLGLKKNTSATNDRVSITFSMYRLESGNRNEFDTCMDIGGGEQKGKCKFYTNTST